MQLFKLLAFAAAAAAQSNFILTLNYTATNITSPGLSLTDFYTRFVSYANGSLFVGQVSTQDYSELFYASYYTTSGVLGFKSYHQSPTGSTVLYIFPNATDPVGITVPHGNVIPEGGKGTGFGFGADGYLTYDGTNNFIGCANSVPASYQIYWLGNQTDFEDPAGKDCIGPLYLYRTNVTLDSGDNI